MNLIYSPDPWLEKQVKPFDFEKLNAEEVAQEMVDIMHSAGGIGLSANQVGLDAQIFVMKPYLQDFKEPFAVINPVIEKVSVETELAPEGCLSHPDLFLQVNRPLKLVAKFLDASAKECIMTLSNIDARCFLHEYDHLQGIEFTDRVSKLKLQMAEKKRAKLRKKYG